MINKKNSKILGYAKIFSMLFLFFILKADFALSAWDPTPQGIKRSPCTGLCNTTDRCCPWGLDFPSFNNFTNNTGAFIPDERSFIRVKNITEGGDWGTSVSASLNDQLHVIALVHNNAYEGQYPANGTKAKLTGFTSSSGIYTTGYGTSMNIPFTISSSNSTPGSITSNFTVSGAGGKKIALAFDPRYDTLVNSGGSQIANLTPSSFFGSGVLIGDPVSGLTSGTYLGCAPYSTYVQFYLYVLEEQTGSPNFNIDKKVNKTGGAFSSGDDHKPKESALVIGSSDYAYYRIAVVNNADGRPETIKGDFTLEDTLSLDIDSNDNNARFIIPSGELPTITIDKKDGTSCSGTSCGTCNNPVLSPISGRADLKITLTCQNIIPDARVIMRYKRKSANVSPTTNTIIHQNEAKIIGGRSDETFVKIDNTKKPEFTITKTNNRPNPTDGQIVQYTITIKNITDINANTITLTDNIKSQITATGRSPLPLNCNYSGVTVTCPAGASCNKNNFATNQEIVFSNFPGNGTATVQYNCTANTSGMNPNETLTIVNTARLNTTPPTTDSSTVNITKPIAPPPTCDLTFGTLNDGNPNNNNKTVKTGDGVTLRWTSTNTSDDTIITVSPANNDHSPNNNLPVTKNITGSKSWTANTIGTYDYSMTVRNADNQTVTCQAKLTVNEELIPWCILEIYKDGVLLTNPIESGSNHDFTFKVKAYNHETKPDLYAVYNYQEIAPNPFDVTSFTGTSAEYIGTKVQNFTINQTTTFWTKYGGNICAKCGEVCEATISVTTPEPSCKDFIINPNTSTKGVPGEFDFIVTANRPDLISSVKVSRLVGDNIPEFTLPRNGTTDVFRVDDKPITFNQNTTFRAMLIGNNNKEYFCEQKIVTVTDTPQPICDSFTVNPSSFQNGDSMPMNFTFNIATRNAHSATVTRSDGGTSFPLNNVNGNTSKSLNLTNTTTFTATVNSNISGTDSAICTATVTMTPANNPVCDSFTVNPSAFQNGDSMPMNFTFNIATRNAHIATVTRSDGQPSFPLNNVNGSTSKSLNLTNTTTFTATVSGTAGTTPATCIATVTMTAADNPICRTFSVNPTDFRPEDSMPKAFNFYIETSNADTVSVARSDGGANFSIAKNGNTSQNLILTQTTTFTATVRSNIPDTEPAICPAVVVTKLPPKQPKCVNFSVNPSAFQFNQTMPMDFTFNINTENATNVNVARSDGQPSFDITTNGITTKNLTLNQDLTKFIATVSSNIEGTNPVTCEAEVEKLPPDQPICRYITVAPNQSAKGQEESFHFKVGTTNAIGVTLIDNNGIIPSPINLQDLDNNGEFETLQNFILNEDTRFTATVIGEPGSTPHTCSVPVKVVDLSPRCDWFTVRPQDNIERGKPTNFTLNARATNAKRVRVEIEDKGNIYLDKIDDYFSKITNPLALEKNTQFKAIVEGVIDGQEAECPVELVTVVDKRPACIDLQIIPMEVNQGQSTAFTFTTRTLNGEEVYLSSEKGTFQLLQKTTQGDEIVFTGNQTYTLDKNTSFSAIVNGASGYDSALCDVEIVRVNVDNPKCDSFSITPNETIAGQTQDYTFRVNASDSERVTIAGGNGTIINLNESHKTDDTYQIIQPLTLSDTTQFRVTVYGHAGTTPDSTSCAATINVRNVNPVCRSLMVSPMSFNTGDVMPQDFTFTLDADNATSVIVRRSDGGSNFNLNINPATTIIPLSLNQTTTFTATVYGPAGTDPVVCPAVVVTKSNPGDPCCRSFFIDPNKNMRGVTDSYDFTVEAVNGESVIVRSNQGILSLNRNGNIFTGSKTHTLNNDTTFTATVYGVNGITSQCSDCQAIVTVSDLATSCDNFDITVVPDPVISGMQATYQFFVDTTNGNKVTVTNTSNPNDQLILTKQATPLGRFSGNDSYVFGGSTTFIATVEGANGNDICMKTVNIDSLEPACVDFSISPAVANKSVPWDFEFHVNTINAQRVVVSSALGTFSLNQSGNLFSRILRYTLNNTTNFTATVYGADGTTPAICAASIQVDAGPPSCTNMRLDKNPIDPGESTTLRWDLRGSPPSRTTVEASNAPDIGDIDPPTKSFVSTGNRTQDTQFQLTLYDGNNQISDICQANLNVNSLVTLNKEIANTESGPWGSSARVDSGNSAYYRITVDNLGGTGNFILTDQIVERRNGGNLGPILSETIICPDAICTGSLSGGGVVVKNFASGGTIIITYERIADNTGIKVGQTSQIINEIRTNSGIRDTATAIIPGPDPISSLDIDKTAHPTVIGIGDLSSYTITYRNNGNTIMNNVEIIDDYDESRMYITKVPTGCGDNGGVLTCQLGSLAPGAYGVITYQGQGRMSGIANNIARILSDGIEYDRDDATVIITLEPLADLYINKDVTPTETSVGRIFTYTLHYGNSGNTQAENVQIIDDYNENFLEIVSYPNYCANNGQKLTCNLQNPLASGSTGSITYTARAKAIQANVINYATISTRTKESNYDNNNAQAVVNILSEPTTFIIEKSASPNTLTNGMSTLYTLTVRNVGDTTGNISLIDILRLGSAGGSLVYNAGSASVISCPSGATCTINPNFATNGNVEFSNFPAGGTAVINYRRTANTAGMTANASVFTNTATLSTGDSAQANVTIVDLGPNFTITKSATPNTLTNGETTTYTITIENTGNASGNTTLTDTLMSGSHGGSLNFVSGSTQIFASGIDYTDNFETSGVIEFRNFPTGGRVIINYQRTASTAGMTADTSVFTNLALLNTGASAQANVIITTSGTNFTIEKYASPDNLVNGQTTTYTLMVRNTGNTTGNVVLRDILGAGSHGGSLGFVSGSTIVIACPPTTTCDISRFETEGIINFLGFTQNSSATIRYQRIASTAGMTTDSSNFTNTAILSTGGWAEEVVTINARGPNIILDKSASPNTLANGNTTTYTLRVENTGDLAGNFTLTDILGAGSHGGLLSFVSGSTQIAACPPVSSCNTSSFESTGIITFMNFPPNGIAEITYQRIANTAGMTADSSSFTNTAILSTGAQDRETVIVNATGPNFTITKNANPDNLTDGDITIYTLTINNTGDAMGNTVLTDILSAGTNGGALNYISGSVNIASCPTVATCTIDDNFATNGTVRFVNFPVNGTAVINYQRRASTSTMTSSVSDFVNTATLSTGGRAQKTVRLNASGITINKTAHPDQLRNGELTTYTISITNSGTTTENNVVITDTLGDGTEGGSLDFVTGSTAIAYCPPISTCNISAFESRGRIIIDNFPVGGTATFTYQRRANTLGMTDLASDFTNTATLSTGRSAHKTVRIISHAGILNISKGVSNTIGGPYTPSIQAQIGDIVEYSINYQYTGVDSATGVVITDDYDQSRLSIINIDTVSALPAGVSCNNNGSQIVCDIGTLLVGVTGEIRYTARIGGITANEDMILNTAVIRSINPPDSDSANASVLVRRDIIPPPPPPPQDPFISKSANPTTLVNGQNTTYTVVVTNPTNTNQTLNIKDTLSADADNILEGNNGGYLQFIESSQRIVFSTGSGQANGMISQDNGITITNLKPSEVVTITYQMQANNATVPVNGSSSITNVVSLYKNELLLDSDTQTVNINGPTSGNGSSSSSGSSSGGSSSGGSSGGGGIVRRQGTIDLKIEKEIETPNGYVEADTISEAVIIEPNKKTTINYRVTVNNHGTFTANAIKIKDEFEGDFTQTSIRDVKGAEWDEEAKTFTLDRVSEKGYTRFTFIADVTTGNTGYGLNNVEITDFEFLMRDSRLYQLVSSKGIGENDDAYLATKKRPEQPPIKEPELEPDMTFSKNVNVRQARRGEIVTYTIIARNVGEADLTNAIITDTFPSQYIEILNHERGSLNGNMLTWQKRIMRPGEIWTIRYDAKIKDTAPINEIIRNIAIFNTDQTPSVKDQAEIIIYETAIPPKPPQTGPVWYFVFLTFLSSFIALRFKSGILEILRMKI